MKKRILHLTLKKKWFDMIASGEKKEEYRELKPYWFKRLIWEEGQKENYTAVRFANGGHFHSTTPQILVELKEIKVGTGKKAWGANPGTEYFVIKLGEIISTKNIVAHEPVHISG